MKTSLVNRTFRFLFILALLIFEQSILFPQEQGNLINKMEMKSVVYSIADSLRPNYVFGNRADSLAKQFEDWFNSENWPERINVSEFASKLEKKLINMTNDLHFIVQASTGNNQAGAIQGGVNDWLGKQYNYGIAKFDWLPGRIGYIDYRMFNFTMIPGAKEIIDQAMKAFDGASAVIIDLRSNSGGDGEMGRYFFSYLIPADSIVLTIWTNRHNNVTKSVNDNSFKTLPSPRLTGKPVYVLISGGTGSTAEMFAFLCKNFKAAHLVGETTIGAGHNMTVLKINETFTLGLPSGRFSDPFTGVDWQQTGGVHPDTECEQENALEVAHKLAIEKLAEVSVDPQKKEEFEYLKKTMPALYPIDNLYDENIISKEGQYGSRKIIHSNGKLYYQVSGRKNKTEPIFLGGEKYALKGGDGPIITFMKSKDGSFNSIKIEYLDGIIDYHRTGNCKFK